jgi:5-methylcytosine-specific restriction protein A
MRLLGAFRARRRSKPVKRQRLTPSVREKVLDRDDRRCRRCQRGPEDGVRLEIDHRRPVARGGSSRIRNLQTLCIECNRKKGASPERLLAHPSLDLRRR